MRLLAECRERARLGLSESVTHGHPRACARDSKEERALVMVTTNSERRPLYICMCSLEKAPRFGIVGREA